MTTHFIAQRLASTQHKITFNLIGCGGTGSHILSNLAMMSHSMVKLGRQPFFVRVWDSDTVSEHNIGRQLFSPADEGRFKAEVLIERINRFYGLQWYSMNADFQLTGFRDDDLNSNITISAVDSVHSRRMIQDVVQRKVNPYQPYRVPYYWFDVGNSYNSGQILMATLRDIPQPSAGTRKSLPDFFDEFGDVQETPNEPSCSTAESLARQDLFVNKLMATYTTHMIWDFLKNFRIAYRGLYVNLESYKVSQIPIYYVKKDSKANAK